MIYILIFAILCIVLVPRLHDAYVLQKNLTAREPKDEDVAIFQAKPQELSDDRLKEILGHEPASVASLHLEYSTGRLVTGAGSRTNRSSYSVSGKDSAGIFFSIKKWMSSRSSDYLSLNNYIAIAKPWIIQLAKARNWDVYENVANVDNYIHTFNQHTEVSCEQAFLAVTSNLSALSASTSFHVHKTVNNSYEISTGISDTPISKLCLDSKATYYEQPGVGGMLRSMFSAKNAPVSWSFSKDEIVGFAAEAGTGGVYISTMTAYPKSIFVLSDEKLRSDVVAFLNAWLYS